MPGIYCLALRTGLYLERPFAVYASSGGSWLSG